MTSKPEFLPDSNATYKDKEYWNKRFEKEDQYDWLVTYDDEVRTKLRQFLTPTDRILMVGCGNSSFSGDLYEDGFHNIVNIDFSESVIEKMKPKHPEMEWLVMDMLDLKFDERSFDVVIDKAAMDALMVDIGDVWNPKESVKSDGDKMCSGISRVLKDEGFFLQISFDQPHFRSRFLNKPEYGWDFSRINLEKGLGYFLYVMKKEKPQQL